MMNLFGLSSKSQEGSQAVGNKSKDDVKIKYSYGQDSGAEGNLKNPANPKPKKQGFLETLKSISTNIRFNWGNSPESPIIFKKKDDRAYLLGKEYNQLQEIDFKNHFKHTIWMTYRKNFLPITKKGSGIKFSSDNGWGCMVRVGQMMFAEALKRHIFKDSYSEVSKQHLALIISAFIEEELVANPSFAKNFSHYSIQKICEQAANEYELGAGEWFNPSNICFILKDLHEKEPLKEAKNMRVVIFNNGMIFLDQIRGKSKIHLDKDGDQEMIFDEEVLKNKAENDGVLVVYIAQIGLDYPNPDYLKFLQELFKIKYFVGMLGGKPGTAYYFLGCYNEGQYMYLDPHLVQDSVGRANVDMGVFSYFCDNIRMSNSTSITPSISIGFYLANSKEIDDFYTNLELLNKNFDEMCFIGLSKVTPEDFFDDSFDSNKGKDGAHELDDDWDIIK